MTDDYSAAEQALNDEIDSWPWEQLGKLADISADRGQVALEAGYRWLIKHHRQPREEGEGERNRHEWFIMLMNANLKCSLPQCCRDGFLLRIGGNDPSLRYNSNLWQWPNKIHEAYRLAAEVVGECILKGEIKP